ncbi:dicarboxylate/amino acid:cation symporter [Halodesulfovibrio sp.]|jgi:Na+/H+-dicarboxylate symporter|uniref:dicarboxylate/amino acid:cation symporter n=1 Tax=Halodesulfovibrio sp. TaxID=1912772 RepID=UPI0025DB7526|nr:dicarboxylate/amino acid:cation symporter [Halodesulfovibrio sp.]MCT4533960.1 dicarboxylate/amino acid:cation symporter [Halodesulfovibrio sp.]MCT4626675.1 dicarboxylate/amino acid:cation symporter [Halodesulfovibrio sp.]
MSFFKRFGEFGLILQLLIGIAVGVAVGLTAGSGVMEVVVSLKYVLGQFIFYTVPLVIIAFIAPAIVRLGQNASAMLFTGVSFAYLSAAGAATMAAVAGYIIIPHLSIATEVDALHELPEVLFQLNIPPVMSVMTALVTALVFGLATVWTKAQTFERIFNDFEKIMMHVVNRVVIPILPFFIATTFAGLAYEGTLTKQLPIFLKVVVIVILGHLIWLTVLYTIAGIISKRNPLEVLRHYPPAYLTAVGTMSSAATLPVSLECASRSKVLSQNVVEFMIPLGATVHLCGSVLTETFFAMTISMMLYGTLPSVATMALFIALFGIFAIGAPGVPGGTVMASLGIVVGVLQFDPAGVALLLAIFALQDSFGTACNVTGDGALALMLEGIFNKNKK